jgi:hypothetical protein
MNAPAVHRHRGASRSSPRVRRVGLVVVMALCAVNIWTGGPLSALWIGSRIQGTGPPAMDAVAATAIALGAITYALVRLLAHVDDAYGRLTGRRSAVRRHVPWLRSMRGERAHVQKHANELSPLELILITTVVVVVVLFEVWFFFYSPSPIDQRSGRHHEAPIIG